MQDVQHLLETLDRLGNPRILVLGDLILDRYTWGDAERISQEAPVIVLRADRCELRLGGASSVSRLLRGLDAQVTLAGVIGDDDGGRQLVKLLDEAGVDRTHLLVDESRPSTVKERFIGRAQNRHPHQILRVDAEVRTPLSPVLEEALVLRVEAALEDHDVLLVSDYDKGVCTPGLLAKCIAAAKKRGVPVVVDPIRSNDYSKYKGATTMTPNRLEAQTATGKKIERLYDSFKIGKQLCRDLDMKAAIITLDRDGMALVPPDGGGEVFPTRARTVYDITGAGDMVLAMIGLCLAAGTNWSDAIRLGNVAGGLEVEKVGVEPVSRDEIRRDLLSQQKSGPGKIVSLDELVERLGPPATRKRKVVFTNGCFDLLHIGHVSYLQDAAAQGDVLVIGLNSDASVSRLKGPTRPLVSQRDRAAVLSALALVDYVTVFDAETPIELIRRIQPDVLVKGGDYRPEEIVGKDVVEAYGGSVYVACMVDGVSTTELVKKGAASAAAKPLLQGPHFARRPNYVDQLSEHDQNW